MDLLDKHLIVLKHTDDLPRQRPEKVFKSDWAPVPLGQFTLREIQLMITTVIQDQFRKEHFLWKVIEGVRYCFTYVALSEGESFDCTPPKVEKKRKKRSNTVKAWKYRKFEAWRDGVPFNEPRPESKSRIIVHEEIPTTPLEDTNVRQEELPPDAS